MATLTGTHDIATLLATRFSSAAEYGLDTIQRILQADIDAHNMVVQQMVGEMAEVTTDRQRVYGTSATGDMLQVDEYSRAPTQKPNVGATVGFPLHLFQYNVGWTRKWLESRTPADMASMVLAAEKAHLRVIQREIKRAIFTATNATVRDYLVDNVSLGVKRLVNADSTDIPDGPNGETFTGASHTHYDGAASLTAAAVTATIEDVVEHGHGTAVKVAIARTNETAFRNLSGFSAYLDPRLILGTQANQPGERVDTSRLDNRPIGIFGAAEVWVKPWVPANYLFAWDAGGSPPLAFRQRANTALQGLRIAATIDAYPLQAEYMEAEFGVGVWNRTNGAVLYFADATYASPTIS